VSHDAEIISSSLQSPVHFTELYERHAATVYRYAARRTDRAVAEDIMSETFLVAFERRGSYDEAFGSALPWLLGIATTLVHKHARVEARAWKGLIAEHLAASVDLDDIENSAARIDASTSMRRVSSAMRRMRDGDRDVLLLHAWGDLTYEQIAVALEIPIGTVRSRLNRARRSLRTAMDRADARSKEVDHGRTDAAARASQ